MPALTKQEAFTLFETYRKELLEYARWIATKVAKENDGYCNIDLVREQIVKLPKFQTLEVDPRVFGATFKDDRWEKIGYKPTGRKIAHQRMINTYRLKPEYRFRSSEGGNLMLF